MKFVIEDANILLDLTNGNILAAWLSLGYDNCTTHTVWAEVKRTGQRQSIEPFIESGLIKLRNIESQDWAEIHEFSQRFGVSVPDASVWLLARKENAILLTGDGALRKAASASAIQVRGILWVLDELLERRRLTSAQAAHALHLIQAAGAFLPREECLKRFTAWENP